MLVRFHRNYYMLRFDKARPLYDLFSERKRVKNKENSYIYKEINLTPILAFLIILKSAVDVVDMLVIFPRNY